MTAEEVKEILASHDHGVNLNGADLRGVNLNGADLRGVNLSGANLSGANLGGANLGGANLFEADLYEANLSGANLYEADLSGANLYEADLVGANLLGADLSGANLLGADLSGADLSGADLSGANMPFIPMACPDEGEFIGWKKARIYGDECTGIVIVKLLIPSDARRSSGTGRKCRCDKAKVLDIQYIDPEKRSIPHSNYIVRSLYKRSFCYKIGKMVVPTEPFDENRFNECASGIHFFINREEAVNY